MAEWTQPQTWTPVVVTVPDMNREVRDHFVALHPSVVSSAVNVSAQTSYGHAVYINIDATVGNRTATLYTAVANTGAMIAVKKTDASANTVTALPLGGQFIEDGASYVLTAQYEVAVFISNGTQWRILGTYRPMRTRTISGTDTVTVNDDLIIVSGGTFTLTLHPASTNRNGRPFTVKNFGTGIVTVDADGAELIDADASLQLYEDDALTVQTTGTGWIIV